MRGPFHFIFTIIWFAIGLGVAGTLKDCTATMGKEAANAHRLGGISYSWWNRQLVGGSSTHPLAIHVPALVGDTHEEKNEKGIRRGNSLSRPSK